MSLPPRGPRYRPTPFLAGSAGLHAAGALLLAFSPASWPAVAGALVADHLAIAAASFTPRSRLLGPNLRGLPADAAGRGEVALTFDDGPNPEITPRVLDLLEAAGARATFFCIGRRVEEHPDLAAEIVRRGHLVENHTWSHTPLFSCLLPADQRREIARAQEAIARVAGREPVLFRAPAGFRNLFLERELRRAGLTLASWTRRAFDTVETRADAVAARLLRGLAPADVLLLHDGPSVARTAHGEPVVLEALPRVLDALAERGLRSVPLEPCSGSS
jgi:peptidoglycan/xylan/chitin deacetylase (PgdA/CDA1 family)